MLHTVEEGGRFIWCKCLPLVIAEVVRLYNEFGGAVRCGGMISKRVLFSNQL
jgi:hypothetical protein